MPKRFIKNKRRVNKRRKPKMSFDLRVRQVINRAQETKKAVYESGLIAFNSGITATADVLKVFPDIAVGGYSWQRVGQKITLTKVVIRGYISTTGPATTSASRSRYGVRHMLCADKQKNDYTLVGTTDLAKLLEAPGADGQYMDGTVETYMTPVNRENFTSRMDKKFPLTQIYEEGDDGKSVARDSIKFFTKTLTFGTNGKQIVFEGGTTPINFKYFMLLGYCYLDGSSPDVGSTDLKMSYTATAYYKDA